MIEVYGYKKCSTVNKAIKFLKNYDEVTLFDFVQNQISETTLKELVKAANLPLDNFFNSNGKVFKELALKDKLANLSDEEKIKLLLSNGLLIKRPLIKINNQVFVGFNTQVENDIKNLLK